MRSILIVLCSLFISQIIIADTGTIYYQDPIQLQAGGVPINLGNRAAPRLVDWDADGDLDLLVGGGDGYIWLFVNSDSASSIHFETGMKIQASGNPIHLVTDGVNTYTGACFNDLTGDGLNDLIIAHSLNRIGYYRNIGTLSNPIFGTVSPMQGPFGELYLPDLCAGRIDVADWNGDGLLDIVAGSWNGYMVVYINDGTPTSPHFQTGSNLTVNGQDISLAYNIQPRIYDLNRDGILDLTFGFNWGNVGVFINDGVPANPHLRSVLYMANADGSILGIRNLIIDDTTPDFADLNNDGVIELISGGANGKIFVMYGISYQNQLNRIDHIMQSHSSNLGNVLVSDPNLRKELFGLHQGMRTFVRDFLIDAETRQPVFDWYKSHINNYPQYLKKQFLDTTVNTYVPSLAGQTWVNLFESLPDSPAHRTSIADTINLQGYYRSIFLDYGVLFIENSKADSNQQKVVYNYLAALPRIIWDCDRITIADFLGSNLPSEVGIQCKMGVNIFGCRIGQYKENSFPSDSPPGWVDIFSACLAHEVNHTVAANRYRNNPTLFARQSYLIRQAAPSQVAFNPDSQGCMDLTSTKTRFLAEGYWDGIEGNWSQAWNTFWSTGPGAAANNRWLRNNLKLMCEAPQESFATLANQYFTNSRTMLNLSLSRFNKGITTCINQFLFFVDVYSCGTNRSYFYTIDTNGNIVKTPVILQRNYNGHIEKIGFDQCFYDFFLDDEGNVSTISGPAFYEGLVADINGDFYVNFEDFALLTNHWLEKGCGDCNDTDLDGDNEIGIGDFNILSRHWLAEPLNKLYGNTLDSVPDWQISGGWSFGEPNGSGGEYGYQDPIGGFSGSNVYGVNLSGDYNIEPGGPYFLTAGPFDCRDYHGVELKFSRWLNTDEFGYVRSWIEASNDGTTWTVLWEHKNREPITENTWNTMTYNMSEVADNQATVYVRWGYEVYDLALPYSGWNIDDIELWGIH